MGKLIFGAGYYGTAYCKQCIKRGEAVLAFIDNNRELAGSLIEKITVVSAEDLDKYEYDKIIISMSSNKAIADISQQLIEQGVPDEKIEILIHTDFNPYDEDTDNRVIWLRDFADYVYSCNIQGNTAECGVFRGYFSKYINKYFHDRKLYLFDTFEGFGANSFEDEIKLGNESFINGDFSRKANVFSATSVELVMRDMPIPDNCIVKKGFFPQTAVDVNDVFCFVNLDMDLYQPMLDGLRFFWEKMTPEGIILLHDYSSAQLPGIKQAVSDFEKEIQRKICKTVIGDSSSMALIK